MRYSLTSEETNSGCASFVQQRAFQIVAVAILMATLLMISGVAQARDRTAPTVPTQLVAKAISQTQADLSWTGSTDNVGVVNYFVYRDGASTAIARSTGTQYSDKTVFAGKTYSYVVKAVDARGNVSRASNTANVATPATASTTTASTTTAAVPSTFMLGLWLWNSDEVLSDATQQNQLVSSAKAAGVTDIFLFLKAAAYTEAISHDRIRAFNALMSQNGIHVWGLEGWRGYFSDAYGPKDFHAAVDNLVLFNKGVAANERFIGFQSDMEPQDGQESFKSTFHNDLTDAQLSTTGGGVWYPTQAQDREMLMRDWLTIHETAHDKMAAAGLKMAAAMPFWTEDYYGTALMVTYKNVRQSVGSHMMNYLNEYIIMSYNTDRNNAAARVQLQAQYASSLPAATRPRISAAMETHPGAGVNVSYPDTPGMNSRQVVLSDMAAIRSILSVYPAFSGVSLHDWVGWKSLNP